MDELTVDDQVLLLRRHCMNLAGYAFSLARRQGLSPEEALEVWMEPAMQRSSGDPIAVDTWIERNAAAMLVFHGRVEVDRDGDTWVMRVDVGNELPPLAAWGAVNYWLVWLTEQARVVAKPHGLHVTSRLDGETLIFRFERGEASA